jgi:hypothetical protein
MMNPSREPTLKGDGIRNRELIRRNDRFIQEKADADIGDEVRTARGGDGKCTWPVMSCAEMV